MCAWVLATFFAFSPAIGAAAGKSPSASRASVNTAAIGIDNFGQVNAGYFRGAQPGPDDYADLAALGIKTVIDLQRDGIAAEQQLVEAAGMTFHRIPMTTRTPPTSAELALFLRLVANPANQPVYVHCAGGRHRTGVMTAVYRITHDGWTADDAFREMKDYKFGADVLHPEFKRFVYGYRADAASIAAVHGDVANATK